MAARSWQASYPFTMVPELGSASSESVRQTSRQLSAGASPLWETVLPGLGLR